MELKDIKTYKDACKIIGRKPRHYKDDHMNVYEELTTIVAAVNTVEVGKSWKPKIEQANPLWEIFYYKLYNSHTDPLWLISYYESDDIYAFAGTKLQFATKNGAEYVRSNFKSLLYKWFNID